LVFFFFKNDYYIIFTGKTYRLKSISI